MHAPYRRVIVMHLTLIFGGWIVLLMGVPTGALIVLLALKTVFDLQAHRREHDVAASKSSAAARSVRL